MKLPTRRNTSSKTTTLPGARSKSTPEFASEDQIDYRLRIWQVVSQIPAGHVATYGQIAQLAGLPGAARFAGSSLRGLSQDTTLPWHRVINARGVSSLPEHSEGRAEQYQRLRAEGVVIRNGKIDLRKFLWDVTGKR